MPNTTPSRIWNANKRGRRDIERLPLDDRRQHVAFHRVHAEEQDEGAENAAIQPDARLASTTINPPRIAPTVGMKANSPAWMPRMNELGMPMMARPTQVTKNTAAMVMIWAISQRSSVSPMRSTMMVARGRCLAGAMNKQPVAVNARAGRRRRAQEQHDEEIADAADGAEAAS
mgnify:CR=1 FL=1